MRRTPREDRAARREREIDDLVAAAMIAYPASPTPNTRADGMPSDYLANPHRLVRVSESSWLRGMIGRTRAYTRTPDGTLAPDTVRVIYADGSSRVESSRGFGRDTTRVLKRDTVAPRGESYQTRLERFGATGDVE